MCARISVYICHSHALDSNIKIKQKEGSVKKKHTHTHAHTQGSIKQKDSSGCAHQSANAEGARRKERKPHNVQSARKAAIGSAAGSRDKLDFS